MLDETSQHDEGFEEEGLAPQDPKSNSALFRTKDTSVKPKPTRLEPIKEKAAEDDLEVDLRPEEAVIDAELTSEEVLNEIVNKVNDDFGPKSRLPIILRRYHLSEFYQDFKYEVSLIDNCVLNELRSRGLAEDGRNYRRVLSDIEREWKVEGPTSIDRIEKLVTAVKIIEARRPEYETQRLSVEYKMNKLKKLYR
jgi:hypothetical protein